MLREFCAENMERVGAAVTAGAGRIELCDNLAVGGTSPSVGVIRAAVAFAGEAVIDCAMAARLVEALGVSEVHGTKIVEL